MQQEPGSTKASNEFASDKTVETAALAGAEAIKRLVAECNTYRSRIAAQDHELHAYRAINEELRRRLVHIHTHYIDFAKKIVAQLEQFDGDVRNVVKEGLNGTTSDSPPPLSVRANMKGHASPNPEQTLTTPAASAKTVTGT